MMPLALMLILAGIRWPRWRVALLAIFVIVGLVRLHCAPAQPFRVSAPLVCHSPLGGIVLLASPKERDMAAHARRAHGAPVVGGLPGRNLGQRTGRGRRDSEQPTAERLSTLARPTPT